MHAGRRERFRADDGLRRIYYYLIGHSGQEQLAVNAKEIKSSGGHYAYHAVRALGGPSRGDLLGWASIQ